jgi:hypothetical protein
MNGTRHRTKAELQRLFAQAVCAIAFYEALLHGYGEVWRLGGMRL